MNNTAIIKDDNIMFPKKYKNIFYYYNTYKKHKLLNAIYRFSRKHSLFTIFFFFSKWKKIVNNYNTFILFDSGCNKYILKYIKRKNPSCKIILWYWNPVSKINNRVLNNSFINEKWTYDPFDAKKYNMKFNPQFFFKDNMKSNNSNIITNDIIFLGKDKGRKENIMKLKKNFENNELKCIFHIIESKKDYIKYEDYIKEIEKSKCILDFNYYLPGGISLRPLEALFLEKKLITNNSDIKNYKFYNKNNIFIIGEDNINEISKFVASSYKKIDKKIVNYYSYEEWFKRFNK